MKKTMKMMLALMAGAMVFTACSSDDMLDNNEVVQAPSQLKPMTFTAVQEGGTRTAIDGLDIKWTAGDKISIFDGATENDGVQMFTIATGQGTTSATFTGSAASASTYYALYPYAASKNSESRIPTQAEAETAAGSASAQLPMWKMMIMMESYVTSQLSSNGISPENQAIILAYLKEQPTAIVTPGVTLDGSNIKNVVIPAEQTATAGSADPQAMVMVAKGSDKDALEFKNVCAYVKVTPQFDCYAIALISKGSENLAGKVTVDCSGETPTTTVTANGTNAVYLVGTITAGNAYYIAVRPEALASGFTIEFLTADKTTYYARSTSNALALARSNVKNLGSFSTSGTWTTTSPTSGNDGNGHSWKLITPTFKMATTLAGRLAFDDIPDWGSDWALLTPEEFSNVYNNGYFTITKDRSALLLQGAGVLKYVGVTEITENADNDFWTSTPGSSADNQMQFVMSEGSRNCLKTNKRGVIFKYNN